MTSELKAAQNKINAARSTGPRTRRGKMRSISECVKHGRRAALRIQVPGEDSVAFLRRLELWRRGNEPRTQEEYCLLHQNVMTSFQLDAVQRAAFVRSANKWPMPSGSSWMPCMTWASDCWAIAAGRRRFMGFRRRCFRSSKLLGRARRPTRMTQLYWCASWNRPGRDAAG